MPGGFIFPGYGETPWINAARMAGPENTAIQLGYGPKSPAGTQQYSASLIGEGKDIGVGIILEDLDSHIIEWPRLTLGASIKLPTLSWGFSLRDDNITDSSFPDAAFSLFAGDKSIFYGMAFRREQDKASIDFGVGFTDEKFFTFELNASIPTFFDSDVTPPYTITASAMVYHGVIGMGVKTIYDVNNNVDQHQISGVFAPFSTVNFIGSIHLPNERYQLSVLFYF